MNTGQCLHEILLVVIDGHNSISIAGTPYKTDTPLIISCEIAALVAPDILNVAVLVPPFGGYL